MSAVCQITGRKPGYGKQVSHSHKRTSRRWEPNLQTRRYRLHVRDHEKPPEQPGPHVLRKYDPIARAHVEFKEER